MKYTTKLLCLLVLVFSLISGIAGCASAPTEKDTTVSSNSTTTATIATTPLTLPSSTPTETVHIHTWAEAVCTMPKTCVTCGATEGAAKEHNYVQGSCTACNAVDPNANSLVWISTKRGTKYHSKPTCSKMKNPKPITKSEAISQGFEPCANCYKQ